MAGNFSQAGIGWDVGMPSGWGTYGTNLAYEFARQQVEPALFMVHEDIKLTPQQLTVLKPALEQSKKWFEVGRRGGETLDFPLLVGLNDGMKFHDFLHGLRGKPFVGVPFFESATIKPDVVESTARTFDLIIAGSSWNAEILAKHGIGNVRSCFQGVALSLFKPGKKTGRFGDRFVIFSGGKLEYRKGQDLVVAAFKQFHQKHPDSLLVPAWYNPWPQVAKNLGMSPHVAGPPPLKADGFLDVAGWMAANGLPEGSFFEPGMLTNIETPPLLWEADLAVFPNRCEGGTNLVAMECMACGVPVALSRNTGHLDLIRPDNCYSLDMQIPIGAVTGRANLEGWGETFIDELVTAMEKAYTDREDARRRGAAGAAFMQNWGWATQVGRLIEALREFS